MEIIVIDLGVINYHDALKVQENLFNEQISNKLSKLPTSLYVLICEHESVFTLGKNGDVTNIIYPNANIPIVKVNRGGDITYHGPGQIVLYPILDLEKLQWGIAKYVEILEELGILLCEKYQIVAKRLEGKNGVWIEEERKIMAIGIKASRYITMHGLAFNVNTNLEPYNHIIPCGIKDKRVTSLSNELGREMNMVDVKNEIVEIFKSLLPE